jgi:anti-anti-sigma factor
MDHFSVITDLDPNCGVFVVHVNGEIDIATAGVVAEAVANRPAYVPDCVIDLSEVTFLDSAGIRMLFECQRMLQQASTSLRLVGLSDGVRRILKIAGVEAALSASREPATPTCG